MPVRRVSAVPEIVLLVVGLAGAWVVPYAPFWVAATLGLLTIVAARRQQRHSPERQRVGATEKVRI
ncbi:hypothetical protein ACTMTJ_39015 [Phytohabitans sp. LJ34]|uniref:hypothetical protein n=1 Tax=Phytohabitans sp. LJ34 TaxID=3452217 RepID=UPI003F8B983B